MNEDHFMQIKTEIDQAMIENHYDQVYSLIIKLINEKIPQTAYDDIEHIIDNTINYFEATNQNFYLANLHLNAGIISKKQSDFFKAVIFFQNAFDLFQKLSLFFYSAKSLYFLGRCYFKQEKHEECLIAFQKAEKYFIDLEEESGKELRPEETELQIQILLELGKVYIIQEMYKLSFPYFEKVFHIASKEQDTIHISESLYGIGLSLLPESVNQSLKYLQQALDFCYRNEQSKLIHKLSFKTGEILESQFQCDKALEIYKSALEYALNENDNFHECKYHTLIAKCFEQKGNFELAIQHLNISIGISQQNNFREEYQSALNLSSNIHKKLNDYENAFYYFQMAMQVKEEIITSKLYEKIEILQKNYEHTQQDLVKEKIVKQIQKKAIDAMAVTINHEINQPLTIITNCNELLKHHLEEEKYHNYLNKIDHAVDRIDKIMHIIKNMNHINFTKYLNDITMIDLNN